ncbi:hypothetical protein GV792_04860 [Nocardia cyriacigeorgica]|uniref:hypothetical protein n=1 Tax=Nocardia cyriacigeorgica TaxID=135487 RepID=UPI0013BB6489|nr:hypothetical protein [Nocardia cyriacigeorgica]NEW49374.1 hypothetical protein [Nocardia cyriacigeorgica]
MSSDLGLHIRVKASMPEHTKVAKLGDKAFRCLIEAWCYCRRAGSDGIIPVRYWKKTWTAKPRAELLAAGLVHLDGENIVVHDWEDYQPTAAALASKREAKAEAGRLGGKKSGESRRAAAAARAAKGEPPTPDPTAPGPMPEGPLSPPVTDGWRLVREQVSGEHPQPIRADLAMRANGLLKSGTPEDDVRQALALWVGKGGVGPGLLPSLVSDVVKARARPTQPSGNPGQLSPREQRLVDAELLKDDPNPEILRRAGVEHTPHLRAITGGAP